MKEYCSIYAPLINRYLEFKRNLGFAYKDECAFVVFDCFVFERKLDTVYLSHALCEEWNKQRPNESAKTHECRLCYIRNFLIYLNRIGYESCVPKIIKTSKSTFTPYIFSTDEIKRFFCVCDSFNITKNTFTPHILPALFRILYGCGLRLGEALSLKNEDVDLLRGCIVIREPKNGCDRKLPISDSLLEILNDYRGSIDRLGEDYFFQSKFKEKVHGRTVYYWFRKILYIAKISHGGRGNGPRIHDFRHTFSVHSMVMMSECGLDLYYTLPILSRYLGHKSLDATEKYVRLTASMYPDIVRKADEICGYVFPEVIHDEG